MTARNKHLIKASLLAALLCLSAAAQPQTITGMVVAIADFGWMSRFRRLARDYERLPETLAGLHFLASAILMLKNVAQVLA